MFLTHVLKLLLTHSEVLTISGFDIVDENGVSGGRSGLLLYKGGTVCDYHHGFDHNAAEAICSDLGYQKTGGYEWTSTRNWKIQSQYKITLGNVKCSEGYWSSCSYSKSLELLDCTHAEDIFLTCKSNKKNMSLELKGQLVPWHTSYRRTPFLVKIV